MKCPFCGGANPETYTICQHCGLSRKRPWYCLLCRNGNPGASLTCQRCGLPRDRGGYETGLPAGWERAEILADEFEKIDDDYVWARLIVKVENHHGKSSSVLHQTAAFKKHWYDEELPPEPMSAEAWQASQELRALLLSEGWQPVGSDLDAPQPFSFWRYRSEQGGSV